MIALASDGPSAAHWAEEIYQGLFRPEGLPRLLLVLEEATKMLAFVIVLCCGTEWEVENIVVGGDVRRRGLGDRLLSELLARGASGGAEWIILEVRESNRAARGLYEKRGFVEGGCRPAYYSDPPEDSILYRFSFAKQKEAAKSLIPHDMK
jgi:ribosomal-protein-alanine N-acetyltransferase